MTLRSLPAFGVSCRLDRIAAGPPLDVVTRFSTPALAADADHDDAPPDMARLTVNEIRRLINVLLVRLIRSAAYLYAGRIGSADTGREQNQPTTPAVSTWNSSP